jgi:hypothetical protein
LHDSALRFYRQARTGPTPDGLRREFEPVNTDLVALMDTAHAALRATPDPAVARAVSRVEYDAGQLANALALGEGFAERRAPLLIRQARTLESQADELLRSAREVVKDDEFGRWLERQVRAFRDAADRFRAQVEANAPADQLQQAFDALNRVWAQTAQGLYASASVWEYGDLRRQGEQIDRLMQTLAGALSYPRPAPELAPIPASTPGPDQRPLRRSIFAVGADVSGGPHVRVFQSRRGSEYASFFAYDVDFQGGVRIAVGDVTGDGIPDVITAPGRGMAPLIRIFDGRGMTLVREFLAFDAPYEHGCYVAAGDLSNNRRADILVGTGEGVPALVRVFDAATGRPLARFAPYEPDFRGGVRVAVADVNGDGVPDIITVPGPGRPVTVRVFDGRNPANVLSQFDAYEPRFQGGAYVAAADLRGDGRAEIVTGADAGGGPHVRVFDGRLGRMAFEFFAYDEQFRGGVRVACNDVTGDGVPDIITAPGQGIPAVVRAFDGRTREPLFEFSAYDPRFQGGAFVASR